MTAIAPPFPAPATSRSDNRDEAFADLVRTHTNLVYGCALRAVREAALAEDVAQAVFLLLWQKRHKIKPGTPIAGWLHVTTGHVARNALRRQRTRTRHESEASAMLPTTTDAPPLPHDPDQDALVDEAIRHLPPRDREALLLRYFQGRSLADVAAATHTTAEAAGKRINRALKKLRDRLTRHHPGLTAPALLGLVERMGSSQTPADAATRIQHALASPAPTATMLAEATTRTLFLASLKSFAAATSACLVAGAVVVGAGVALTSSTRPAPQTAPSVAATPPSAAGDRAQIFATFNAVLAAIDSNDPDATLSHIHCATDAQRRIARAQARTAAAVAALHRAFADTFGPGSASALSRAPEQTTLDPRSVVTVTGDRAAVRMPGSQRPIDCLRVEGKWLAEYRSIVRDEPRFLNPSPELLAWQEAYPLPIEQLAEAVRLGQYPEPKSAAAAFEKIRTTQDAKMPKK